MKEPKLRFPKFIGDWEQKKLGDLSNIIDPHPSHRAPAEEENGIPFIGIGDVDVDGNIDYEKARKVNESIYDDHHKRYDLSIPSLGIGRVASLGKVIRLRNDIGKYAVSPTMSIMQFKKNSNIDFLYAAMSTQTFQRQFTSQSNGTTRQSVGIQDLRATEVSISPNEEEQQKIGSLFAELDTLIQSAEKELEGYRELKQGMLQKMFPKKGETVPEIRFPEFTGDWEQHRLSEICGQLKNTINPMDTPDDYYIEYSMPAFDDNETATCAMGKTMNSVRKVIDKPCLLVNKLNVRKKRIWNVENPESNAVCSAEFVPLYSLGADLTFVKYTLFTDYFTSYLEGRSSGSSNSQKRVTPDVIMQAKVTIPTCDEQKKIGEYFSNLDNLITLQQQELDGYKELKKGLLQQMFC